MCSVGRRLTRAAGLRLLAVSVWPAGPKGGLWSPRGRLPVVMKPASYGTEAAVSEGSG